MAERETNLFTPLDRTGRKEGGITREIIELTSYTVKEMPKTDDHSPEAYRDRLDPLVADWTRNETPIRTPDGSTDVITSFSRTISRDQLGEFDELRTTASAAGYQEAHAPRVTVFGDRVVDVHVAFRHSNTRPIPDGKFTERRKADHARAGGLVSARPHA